MGNPHSQWLISGIENSQIKVIRDALKAGADPDTIDEATKQAALQLSITKDDVAIFNLLLDGVPEHPDKKANINSVGYHFETCIELASKTKLTNKISIMKSLIERRSLIQEQQLHHYVSICSTQLNHFPLQEDDFALMANYVSRLCGVHVGDVLDKDNNDDRYLVHLCQYSYAEKNDNELEGWEAFEFLPIRILSLFETLVKLKKGLLLVDPQKTNDYEKILSAEILLEIETFKLVQESYAIEDAVDIEADKKDELYDALACTFLTRLKNNAGREFSLASGYRGHAIYIAFRYSDEKIFIRFDNLGVGIKKIDRKQRHFFKDGKVYPKEIAVASSNQEELRKYIKGLFKIKDEKIPGKDYREFSGEEKEKKRKEYEAGREEKLKFIYDDSNTLKHEEVPIGTHGMPEQEADTCVATSHQVGLLIRINDKSFYEWIVAEEKRCIVQINRNSGTKRAHEDVFWSLEQKIDFQKIFKYANCCSVEKINELYEKRLSSLQPRLKKWDFNASLVNQIIALAKKTTSPEGQHHISELQVNVISLLQHLNNRDESREEILDFKNHLQLFNGILYVKKGLSDKHDLEKFKNFQKAHDCFLAYGQNNPDFGLNYFAAISAFFIGNHELSKQKFEYCLSVLEEAKNLSSNHINRIQFNFKYGISGENIDYLENITKLALGFLNISMGNYAEAQRIFESTATTNMYLQGKTYSSEALLGLGIIYDHLCRDESIAAQLKEVYVKSAIDCFKKSSNLNKPTIYHMAQQLLKELSDYLKEQPPALKKQKTSETEDSIANSPHTLFPPPKDNAITQSTSVTTNQLTQAPTNSM